MRKKLVSAVKTVEALLAETAGDTLNAGNVTVVNQRRQLRRAYDYFRERATNTADAFREYERAIASMRAGFVRALVDEGMSLTDAGKHLKISRQAAARLYEPVPGRWDEGPD